MTEPPNRQRPPVRTGLLVAAPAMIAAMLAMQWHRYADAQGFVQPPLAINWEIVEPEPEPEPEPTPVPPVETPVPLELEEPVETAPPTGEVGEGGTAEQASSASDGGAAGGIADWEPDTKGSADLSALSFYAASQQKALEQRRAELKRGIAAEEHKTATKDFKTRTQGNAEGVIRLLDVEGYSEEIVGPIFNRYGIERQRSYTRPKQGKGFLNAAVTNEGTFKGVHQEGLYDIMVLSSKAIGAMAMKEITALERRKLDRSTTRVVKVTFGIVGDERGGYDMDVISMETESIK